MEEELTVDDGQSIIKQNNGREAIKSQAYLNSTACAFKPDQAFSKEFIPSYVKNSTFLNYENKLFRERTLAEYLLDQIACYHLTEEEKSVAILLVGNINDKGYLDLDLNAPRPKERWWILTPFIHYTNTKNISNIYHYYSMLILKNHIGENTSFVYKNPHCFFCADRCRGYYIQYK